MIESMLRRQNRILFLYGAAMFLGLGILWGFVATGGDSEAALLWAVVIWIVLMLAAGVAQIVVARRSDRALRAYVAATSPQIAADEAAPLVPAQIVRRRTARTSPAYVAGYAATRPPALVLMLRVLAPEGPRLAVALAPPRGEGYRARSYVGVRVDPAHPDAAVLDLAATPEEMGARLERARAQQRFTDPAVGWGGATRWALAGYASGLAVGLVVGVLLP